MWRDRRFSMWVIWVFANGRNQSNPLMKSFQGHAAIRTNVPLLKRRPRIVPRMKKKPYRAVRYYVFKFLVAHVNNQQMRSLATFGLLRRYLAIPQGVRAVPRGRALKAAPRQDCSTPCDHPDTVRGPSQGCVVAWPVRRKGASNATIMITQIDPAVSGA